jgi:predicted transcriptional regulator
VARFDVAGRRLGELEVEVLRRLWAAAEPLTAQEVAAGLLGPPRALTTVLTVLSRLTAKGLVQRVDDGPRNRYRAAGDHDQLTAQAIDRLLTAATDRRAVLAHLVGELADAELRAELAALLEADPPPG